MTGNEAKCHIIDKRIDYIHTNKSKPKKVVLGYILASDLTKCSAIEIGPQLAELMWKKGEQALEEIGFLGLQVSIDHDTDDKVEFSE